MRDYYALMARAVARLEHNTSPARRQAIYNRARNALLALLRNCDPPMSETNLRDEILALERAIATVEFAAARVTSGNADVSMSGPALGGSRALLGEP
jgi:hypothetical protein